MSEAWFAPNPFDELYAGELVAADQFVDLFSPVLVRHSSALFQRSNVVVKGTQGSGKTMLLALLRPDQRIAYASRKSEMPIPKELRKFIGAGISIKRSAAIDFGQRAVSSGEGGAPLTALCFGDFLNYWLASDILRSTIQLGQALDGEVAQEVGIRLNSTSLDRCARRIAAADCWHSALEGCTDYAMLQSALQNRILVYRRFLNYSLHELPDAILSSISPVGEPLAVVVEALQAEDVVDADTAFFVRIDEYDALARLKKDPADPSANLQHVINKAMGLRDRRVNYRIGTRPYGWRDARLFGTDGLELELDRDYTFFDIDEKLRRKTSGRWAFTEFANDVLSRRLTLARLDTGLKMDAPVKQLFGSTPTPEKKAQQLVGTRSQKRGLLSPGTLPESWKDSMRELAKTEVLHARLAEAWLAQRRASADVTRNELGFVQPPWQGIRGASIWLSSRRSQALVQVAWQSRKRLPWAGNADFMALSGEHILAFLSLCKHVWAAWSRSLEEQELIGFPKGAPPPSVAVQSVAIDTASAYWHRKMLETPELGHAIRDFVDYAARVLRRELIDDFRMSYPGRTGFSVRVDELEALENREIADFLGLATDYGHLISFEHSTKAQDRRLRRKYYIRPVLAPFYQLPANKSQEPLYVSVHDVANWLEESRAVASGIASRLKVLEPGTREGTALQLSLMNLDEEQ